jgi:N-terminal domain of (some) glycogen debranching enzymes
MRLEITIGPPLLTINQGQTVLACEPDGRIQGGSDKGLFFFDTRVISVYDLAANGASFKLLNAGPVYYYASRSMLTNEEIETEAGPIPAGVLSVTLSRSIDGGLHEDIDITNYGSRKVRFNLEIVIRSDFADIFEIKSGEIVRRGRTRAVPGAHHDHALDPTLCPGIRKALEPLHSPGWAVVAR